MSSPSSSTGVFGELRRERFFLRHHGHHVVEFLVADDDAAGVLAELANHALQDFALFEDVAHFGVVLDLVAEFRRHFQSFFERHFQLVGNHFRDGVCAVEGNAVDARQVAHDSLCAELAVCHDVRHPVHAVLAADVFDDVAAAAFAEVYVEVGRRHAFERKHTLEKARLKRIGSMSVILMRYAIMQPAPLPRPGPTGMPWLRAQLMKVVHD